MHKTINNVVLAHPLCNRIVIDSSQSKRHFSKLGIGHAHHCLTLVNSQVIFVLILQYLLLYHPAIIDKRLQHLGGFACSKFVTSCAR